MTTPILVVGTGVAPLAPARFSRALTRAGAAVSLLVPSNAWARHTRHVVRVGLVPDGASGALWIEALFALIDVAAPRAIVLADAGALRFATALALAPPPSLRPERASDLARHLEEALGPADRWPARLNPRRTAALMGSADVRTPESRRVAPAAAADDGAQALDGAVIVRATAAIAATAAAASGEVAAPDRNEPRALVERRIVGRRYTHHVATYRGRVLASATAEHVEVDDASGHPTVLRFCVHDDIARRSERAVAALGASGCCALEFVVDAAGDAWLVDVARHIVPTSHVSQWLGVDLADAWLAALEDRAYTGATTLRAGTSRHSATFPQEWQRDRRSPWLLEQRVDVPWDDPQLLDAILDDAVGATHDH